MDASPLYHLPGELRNQIWRYTLLREPVDITEKIRADEPALLATCRQIRSESSSIYYGENTFRLLYDQETPSVGIAWLEVIGFARANQIRRLQIAHVECPCEDWKLLEGRDQEERLAEVLKISRHFMDGQLARALAENARAAWRDLASYGVRPLAMEVMEPVQRIDGFDAVWVLYKEALEKVLEAAQAQNTA